MGGVSVSIGHSRHGSEDGEEIGKADCGVAFKGVESVLASLYLSVSHDEGTARTNQEFRVSTVEGRIFYEIPYLKSVQQWGI